MGSPRKFGHYKLAHKANMSSKAATIAASVLMALADEKDAVEARPSRNASAVPKSTADAEVAAGANREASEAPDDRGDERCLQDMKQRLASDGLGNWANDLEMERRGKYPYYFHPRLAGRYDRYTNSGGHMGLREAILDAEAAETGAAEGGSRAANKKSEAPAAQLVIPARGGNQPPAATTSEQGQISETFAAMRSCIGTLQKATRRLEEHLKKAEEKLRQQASDLQQNEEGILAIETQIKALKRARPS